MLIMINYIKFCLWIFLFFVLASCGAKKKIVLKEPDKTSGHSPKSKGERSNAKVNQYYADLLKVDTKDLNQKLYVVIDEWIGVSHRLGGMDRSGIDCSGFVTILYEQVYDKKLPRISSDMANTIKRKYDDQLKEGDLVFFSFGGKKIDHVGIYLHNDKFVHVSTKQGVVISNLKEPWYYRYFTRCGTPK